jgi:hypothetical protein
MLIAMLVGTVACEQRASPGVTAGQPQLITLNPESLQGLRTDFNRDQDRSRIILLLSPT